MVLALVAAIRSVKTNSEFLSPSAVRETLNIPESTQRYLRARGDFPPHYKVGRRILYLRADVEDWLETRRQDRGALTEAIAKNRATTTGES
ncbi:helix-turn-helix domain-containing protein [Rhodococcus pyridinivorans]|uniref:helix-turn-helix transcriptional regulator n=1 Tax=Rhodococcus pyridinivorans TaxID=103816 RepID=UPI0009B8802C